MKKATNLALMRLKNEKIILSLINKCPLSRADIAKSTGLTKAAVSIIVDDLKQRRIVVEKTGRSNTVGRTPVMLYLNEKAYYTVGVNITRYHVYVGITDLGGNVIEQDQFSICPPNEAFDRINTLFQKQISSAGIDPSRIYKLAVVTPGPVDTQKGVVLNPPNFNAWHNICVVEELEKYTGLSVILENVSSATAIAEKYFGAATDAENFLVLRVDEGIGSGMILSDSLFKGPFELGHTSIKYDGVKCECGNRGCLEKYAAIPRILENTRYKSWQQAVDSDDDALLDTEAEYLSTAIISANNLFSFGKVVLCGDIAYKPQKMLELLNAKIERRMLSNNTLITCAGQIGSRHLTAASVAIHDFFV